jgi:hypothetical protein
MTNGISLTHCIDFCVFLDWTLPKEALFWAGRPSRENASAVHAALLASADVDWSDYDDSQPLAATGRR